MMYLLNPLQHMSTERSAFPNTEAPQIPFSQVNPNVGASLSNVEQAYVDTFAEHQLPISPLEARVVDRFSTNNLPSEYLIGNTRISALLDILSSVDPNDTSKNITSNVLPSTLPPSTTTPGTSKNIVSEIKTIAQSGIVGLTSFVSALTGSFLRPQVTPSKGSAENVLPQKQVAAETKTNFMPLIVGGIALFVLLFLAGRKN